MRFHSIPVPDFRLGRPGFYVAGFVTLYIAYAIVLAMTYRHDGLVILALTASANTGPIVFLGAGVRFAVRRFLAARGPAFRLPSHFLLALLFTIIWFWLVMVLLGAIAGRNAVEFSVRPFLGPAAGWQLFQGLLIYALVAVLAETELILERAAAAPAAAEPPLAATPLPPRLFVKREDEIRPLDPERIILARGADDYSEVVTATGSHLLRLTLAALAERLGDGFIRVHRSCLVGVRHIDRAEPAGGGRILLHMASGEMITTSRAGARLLRERIV